MLGLRLGLRGVIPVIIYFSVSVTVTVINFIFQLLLQLQLSTFSSYYYSYSYQHFSVTITVTVFDSFQQLVVTVLDFAAHIFCAITLCTHAVKLLLWTRILTMK